MKNDLELKKVLKELKEINQQLMNAMSSINYCRLLIKESSSGIDHDCTQQKLPIDN